jgi:cell division protein FtsB
MGGSSKRKRARRAAAAAAAAENARLEAERVRIQTETDAMQRGMGEELAAKRKARMRGGMGLLSAARAGVTGEETETLG